MNAVRKRRLKVILLIMLSITIAVTLVLYALRSNINLYFTPSQVDITTMKKLVQFRMGGMVVDGSVHRDQNGLDVQFQLTDYKRNIAVKYHGLLPALFREGQGIVVQGHLDQDGKFVATQVLAKHDERYMPPEVVKKHDT